MKELNPTIKKFYEDMYKTEVKTESGSYFYVESLGGGIIFLAFHVETFRVFCRNMTKPIDLSRFDKDELVYFFNVGAHKEWEMLKMIKMKAFL